MFRLQTIVSLRMAVLKGVIMAVWAVGFYFAIVEEINDETDDSLRDYAELIITRFLAGQELPLQYSEGATNHYRIKQVTEKYAHTNEQIKYADREVYFADRDDYEPARTISYIFPNANGMYYQLTVYTPTIDKTDMQEAILLWTIALFTFLFIGMICVNIWTLHYSMRPLHRLLAWLDRYRLGQRNEPLENKTNVIEFRQLNEATIRNLNRNERIFEEQKRFIGNASHEMQTPIAVCINRLEMMLDDESLSEQQMGEIIKTLRTLRSLSSNNKSLLLLSKIDNGQFSDKSPVNLTQLCSELLTDLQMVFVHKKIKVTADTVKECTAEMDPALARIMVANLLKNAFVHTDSGEITITSDANGITIANTANGMPLDATKIFERFYHTPNKKSSTGLGLPIVKAIVNQNSMMVKYTYIKGMHTFRVGKI